MVDVIKPKEEWFVKLIFSNKECPYLYFPANYYGCMHPNNKEDAECGEKSCPAKLKN